ncbi:MAG TPA: BlaI/MecI/CopY family transcriptional regulator [Firmicutes bacterium]|nr:BlaI/MecI/CopY family transcriptional regulator [Bacillota bacterium]
MRVPKIQESELKVMDVLWERAPITASEIAALLAESTGWSKNTTYTVITKLVKKGIVQRTEPNFVCSPLIRKEQVQLAETTSLAQKLYNGSLKLMFARLIEQEAISDEELAELKALIEERGKENG